MKKNYKSIFVIIILIIILFIFIINVDLIINNIISYTITFFNKLFPVCFILYLIFYILIEFDFIYFLNQYLHINSCGIFVFILSLINGFPSGSKYTKLLYDKKIIDREYANILLRFTHSPNILFVLGTIKSIMNDTLNTYYILLSIIFSNLLIMLFSKKKKINIISNYKYVSFSKALGDGIIYSCKTLLLIYGTSLFFYLISSVIFIDNLYLMVLFNGIFDLTNGVVSCNLINSTYIKGIFILLFLSFGSIPIHMQVSEIIGDELEYSSFLKGRIIGSLISILFFYFFNLLGM